MSKILKPFRFLVWVLGLLLSIAIITPIVAYFFFDPNHYKTQLGTWITHKTGLPLEIQGDITLSLFPWIGLNVKDVVQGEVIKAQEVGFKMSLNTLFRSSITIDSLVLKGVEINLVKGFNGSNNWETYQPQQISAPWVDLQRKTQPSKPKKLSFALSHIEIQNAKIRYEDKQQKQTILLENLQLSAKSTQQNNTYPVSGKYSLSLYKNTQQPIARGQGHFTGEANFAKNAPFATHFHTSLSLDLPTQPTSWQQAKLALDVDANAKKIALKQINLQAGSTRLNGEVTLPLDPMLPIKFALNLNQLNADQLLSTTPSEKNTSSVPKSSIPSIVPEKAPPKATKPARLVEGDLSIQELIIQHLKLTQVKTSLKMDGNRLQCHPLTASFYGGKLNLKASKELTPNAPTALQGTVTHVQLQPLLRDLKQPEKITGTTFLDFNLSHGKQGFNGTLKFLVKQGTLTGIDIRYYLYLAKSLFKKEKITTPDSHSTVFGDLTGTLYINNNVIDNNDLSLQATDLKAKGDGSIDLNTQTIAYKMQAMRIKSDEDRDNDFPLAIRIKGSLQHPKVEPDLDVYLKAAVQKDLKNALNKQIERQLGKVLDKNPQETEQSAQDKLQEKIDKEINKGLKKLFKLKDPNDS